MLAVKYEFQKYETIYVNSLIRDAIPFWEKNSVDREHGGFLTCLTRTGRAFDTDKFIGAQAGQVWAFSMLYNRLEKKAGWLELARHGAAFLMKYGRGPDGRWFEAVDVGGAPVRVDPSLTTEAMVAMALAQYAQASGEAEAADLARATFQSVRGRIAAAGQNSGGRALTPLLHPVLLTELSIELGSLLEESDAAAIQDDYVRQISSVFFNREKLVLHDFAAADGSHPDCIEGRLIQPGQGFAALRLLLDIARRRSDKDLTRVAVEGVFGMMKVGWDQQHGGVFCFVDALGKPSLQPEWDQKHWWVQLEALTALLLAYAQYTRGEVWAWFEKVHQYIWRRFPDPEYGEWFGYLRRQGDAVLNIKGGPAKGCYHLAKSLQRCSAEFRLLGEAEKERR